MSDDEFDAASAAARATGEEPSGGATPDAGEGVAPDHVDAEGAPTEDTIGNASRWREMLMSSDPDPPLEDVDSPWDPDLGGPTRIYRGLMKIGGFDGMPALGDLAIGFAETLSDVKAEPVDGDGDDVQEDVGEEDPII